MSSPHVDALCTHCGQALADFLQEMKEHNAEVVCPACGKTQKLAHSAKLPEHDQGQSGSAHGNHGNGSKNGRLDPSHKS